MLSVEIKMARCTEINTRAIRQRLIFVFVVVRRRFAFLFVLTATFHFENLRKTFSASKVFLAPLTNVERFHAEVFKDFLLLFFRTENQHLEFHPLQGSFRFYLAGDLQLDAITSASTLTGVHEITPRIPNRIETTSIAVTIFDPQTHP